MTGSGWKIALAASVALNLFGLAAGVAAWVAQEKAQGQVLPGRATAERSPGFREIMDGLDPKVRDRVRATLRASAEAARPDFQQARDMRQKAIALAASPAGDADEIKALIDQSRAAEIRGRERLEHDVIPVFATLGPADRRTLSVILQGRGGHYDKRRRLPSDRPNHSQREAQPPATGYPRRRPHLSDQGLFRGRVHRLEEGQVEADNRAGAGL